MTIPLKPPKSFSPYTLKIQLKFKIFKRYKILEQIVIPIIAELSQRELLK
jgi:hypothetical protein